ncbi:MAG: hypothetical protein ACTSUE_00030 [Promethearchaeota archaeon]
MSSMENCGELVYMGIVDQFNEAEPDLVNVFREINRTSHDPRVSPDVFYNTLMLVLGLMHRDDPVESVGSDLFSQSDDRIDYYVDCLKDAFVE